jgi:glutathione peroxidase
MTSFHDFSMTTLQGKEKALRNYQGKAVLVVNVASKCGLTPQYKGLQKLHQEWADKGLAVVGFPANEFGAQEPGTDEEIQDFCSANYGVEFDMFSKIVVKGEGQHPLYQWLTSSSEPSGDITWNFEKFLIGKDGQILARFSPTIAPDDDALLKAIKTALT